MHSFSFCSTHCFKPFQVGILINCKLLKCWLRSHFAALPRCPLVGFTCFTCWLHLLTSLFDFTCFSVTNNASRMSAHLDGSIPLLLSLKRIRSSKTNLCWSMTMLANDAQHPGECIFIQFNGIAGQKTKNVHWKFFWLFLLPLIRYESNEYLRPSRTNTFGYLQLKRPSKCFLKGVLVKSKLNYLTENCFTNCFMNWRTNQIVESKWIN